MRVVALIFASGLVVTGCDRPGSANEGAVLTTALSFFELELEKQQTGSQGLILLSPTTTSWTRESIRHLGDNPQASCKISDQLYDALPEHEMPEQDVSALMPKSERWKIVTGPVSSAIPPFPLTDNDAEPIKTIVRVGWPAFSPNGNEGLVLMYFTWSIHTALARVRLVRNGAQWHAVCVQLNYYP